MPFNLLNMQCVALFCFFYNPPYLMLVHIVVSCDDNPFLDPGLRVASLHSLQNVEK